MKSKKSSLLFEVAKWEFSRWFKIKEQILTLIIGTLVSFLIFGGGYLLNKTSSKEVKVVVINSELLSVKLDADIQIKIVIKEEKDFESQQKLLRNQDIDGILRIRNIDSADLFLNKEAPWVDVIKGAISESRRQIKLELSNISQEQLADIFQPVELNLNFTGDESGKSTTGEKITAGIFIGLMLLGVFIGLAYQFVAITGEKQLRITEVIVSAISPQTWIDGKIIGISMLSLVQLLTYSITSVVFVVVSSLFQSGWSLPIGLSNPLLIFVLLLFSLAGFFLWNTFFSAIAATINDPNTSARGSLIMVPVIPVVFAFFALGNPDSLIMKILSVFPLTSAPVISARLVLTDVGFVEIIISLSLLIATTYYLRKAAGKIFALSVLMYGKEPSWKEISKWLGK